MCVCVCVCVCLKLILLREATPYLQYKIKEFLPNSSSGNWGVGGGSL